MEATSEYFKSLEEINEVIGNTTFTNIETTDPILIKKLHDLYFKDINDDSIEKQYYYGTYYHIKKDYDNMKKYYLKGIEKCESDAMNGLGKYYFEKYDYENALKYFLMASEKGNSTAINNLGVLYQTRKKYDIAVKYYLMAMEKNNKYAPKNLENYYKFVNMKKYNIFTNLRDDERQIYTICQLAEWYKKHDDFDNALKYYQKAYDIGIDHAYFGLLESYKDDTERFITRYNAEKNNVKRKIMEEYAINKLNILFI